MIFLYQCQRETSQGRRRTLLVLVAVAAFCFVILWGCDLSQSTQSQVSAFHKKEDGLSTHMLECDDKIEIAQLPLAAHDLPESTTKTHLSNQKVVWSHARADRSGSAIQDMLMCHAYAFQHGMIYGGACAENWTMPRFQGKRQNHDELLEAIGLSNVLNFDCPQDPNSIILERQVYGANDTAVFTPAYLDYLQKQVNYSISTNQGQQQPQPQQQQIAVHIRRGDVSPCGSLTQEYPRYLTNNHYLRLIDQYNIGNTSHVIVFSESKSFERFDKFINRGYEVVLDGSVGDVWKGMLNSNVMILSRSSFSFVPAILSKGTFVYTPFWHAPLPSWEVVEESYLNQTYQEYLHMRASCRPKKVN